MTTNNLTNVPQNNYGSGVSVSAVNTNSGSNTITTNKVDFRARLRPFSGAESVIYGAYTGNKASNGPQAYNGNLMSILWNTGGLIWPYTPTIQIQQNVEYSDYAPTHSNQDFKAYRRTPAFSFSCSGVWTAQNEQEKAYCLAGIHFLRTVTKMYFGANTPNKGTPPPVLLFSAYGNLMFNDLPVIINSFNIDFGGDTDYVQYNTTVGQQQSTGTAWLPAKFNVSVNLTVQKTPSQLRNDFNLEDFRTGSLLLKGKGGWF